MKKRLLFGLGAAVAGIASALAVKIMMDKDYHTVPENKEEDKEDRGVAPLAEESKEEKGKKTDEVQNLKADAINDGYQPVKD